MVLKLLACSTSKGHFIYFITLLYNTPNSKCSIFIWFHLKWYKQFIKIIRKRENLRFLIEESNLILIKYCILFLIICYGQLVFIPVYYSCKTLSFNFSNNTYFFLFFGGKIVFVCACACVCVCVCVWLKYNYHCEYFYCFCQVFGLDNCYLG